MYTIPAAYFLAIAPQTFSQIHSQLARRNHRNTTTSRTVARAVDAGHVGLSGLGFFAGSVVAANLALILVHANGGTLNKSFGRVLILVNSMTPVRFVNSASLTYLIFRAGAMYDYVFWNNMYGTQYWDSAASMLAVSLYWWAADALCLLVR